MEKFKKIVGIAAPFTRINVDTDFIIPAENLKTISKQGLGKDLFSYIYGSMTMVVKIKNLF